MEKTINSFLRSINGQASDISFLWTPTETWPTLCIFFLFQPSQNKIPTRISVSQHCFQIHWTDCFPRTDKVSLLVLTNYCVRRYTTITQYYIASYYVQRSLHMKLNTSTLVGEDHKLKLMGYPKCFLLYDKHTMESQIFWDFFPSSWTLKGHNCANCIQQCQK